MPSAVSHPHILPLYDSGSRKGIPLLCDALRGEWIVASAAHRRRRVADRRSGADSARGSWTARLTAEERASILVAAWRRAAGGYIGGINSPCSVGGPTA